MRIFVDGMGGDNAPIEVVKGCILAIQEYDIDLSIIGNEDLISMELSKYHYDKSKIIVIPSTEVIENTEEPALAIRRKKDSSLVVGLESMKQYENSVIISAGSTGALLAGGLLKLGRIKGIYRPALAPALPTQNGISLLLDAGANADCKSSYLQQFAIMGSIYMKNVLGIENPRVGLINIGSEEKKGNELVKETYQLLKESDINFIGNVEAREIPNGVADVLVCDGFTGNIVLKLTEGVAMYIFKALKDTIMASTKGKIGGMLLKSNLKDFKNQMDYSEYGGAPLLGVKGGVIKAHGSSDAKAIKNAIRQGIKFIENDVLSEISKKIVEINE